MDHGDDHSSAATPAARTASVNPELKTSGCAPLPEAKAVLTALEPVIEAVGVVEISSSGL